MKITKAVIPAAGYGTRFLPITKAVPKEMLPVLEKPVLHYVVEEAVASGVKDIVFVINPWKKNIAEYFSPNLELERYLKETGKTRELEEIQKISKLANFVFINQKGPYGNGTPVLNAKEIIGDEPFAVMWGDDITLGEPPCLSQMMTVFEKYADPVLCAKEISDEETKKYGVIDGLEVEKNVLRVKEIIEKPGPKKAPSRLGAVGRYILTPDIFGILGKTALGHGRELWLVDAIFTLAKSRPLYAAKFIGKYYDIGSVAGWLSANSDFAKKQEKS